MSFLSPSFLIQNQRTGGWTRSWGWRGKRGALIPVGGGGCGEIVKEGEYGANTMYTCMKMEK
jgi:hypothetical protein